MTKKISSVAELAQHAREIARAFKIKLQEHNGPMEIGFALPEQKGIPEPIVACAVIVDEARYAVAMHEIGHIVDPMGVLEKNPLKRKISVLLLEEEAAWKWAEHYSLDWTPTMEHVRLQAFASYENLYKEIQRREARRKLEPARVQSVADFLKGIR